MGGIDLDLSWTPAVGLKGFCSGSGSGFDLDISLTPAKGLNEVWGSGFSGSNDLDLSCTSASGLNELEVGAGLSGEGSRDLVLRPLRKSIPLGADLPAVVAAGGGARDLSWTPTTELNGT
mmetsp:Transcript_19299/g.39119  ORF Transcript_19299/g.39119 Transcript_19299/m.39119 type:complete len:120 (+) Transcript_19299:148-507(+)